MQCQRCRTRNNYYHSYCYNCGAKLDGSDVRVEYEDIMPEASRILLNKRREMFNPYRDRKQSRKRIIYAALISATAVTGAVCWIVMNG